MITIDDKLYITKEVNKVVIRYAKEVVLRQLLLDFSFKNPEKPKKLTNIIEAVNFDIDACNHETLFKLMCFQSKFLQSLDKEKITALNFYALNYNYLNYFYDTDLDETDESSKNFDYKFGRELAYRIYEPESSGLNDELDEWIKKMLYCFANEFDFSLIDKYTKRDVLEMISSYCA